MQVVMIINWIILIYLILFSFGYVLLLLFSVRDVFLRFQEVKRGDVLDIMKLDKLPPVSVLMAVYNGEKYIENSIESVLKNDYNKTSIIVINDGSTDKTLSLLIDKYKLHKTDYVLPNLIKNTSPVNGYYVSEKYNNLVVIDKPHRCKSDSLNVGLNACHTPLFMTFDADSIMDKSAISELVFYIMTREHMVAAGGSVYILNGCKYQDGVITESLLPKHYVAGVQACEYLRSFLFSRAGWTYLKGALSYSGTCTLLETSAVANNGGFDLDNHANDFEVIVNLHAHKKSSDIPYQIGLTPAATVWTEVPATLKDYWRQRINWQTGALRSLLRHKYMLFNPKYGVVGLFNYPFYLFGETLGHLVELTAYTFILVSWLLGIFNGYAVILFLLICLGFITLLSMLTILLSLISYNKYNGLRDLPRILFYVLTEPFGFRQFSVVCRTVGTIRYFFTRRTTDKKS